MNLKHIAYVFLLTAVACRMFDEIFEDIFKPFVKDIENLFEPLAPNNKNEKPKEAPKPSAPPPSAAPPTKAPPKKKA